MYGTTLSFRARVDAITELEVFDSDTTFTPAAGGSEYITNQITLYCQCLIATSYMSNGTSIVTPTVLR